MPAPCLSPEIHHLIDTKCDQFEQRWRAGNPLSIESLIEGVAEDAAPELFRELLLLELELRSINNEQPRREDFLARFPSHSSIVQSIFSDGDTLEHHGAARARTRFNPDYDSVSMRPANEQEERSRLRVRCPSCHAPMEVAVDTALTDLTCSSCGSHFSLVDQSQATRAASPLLTMGRFELIERAGVGGFGTVWKARDKDLDRTVAIKIPRQGVMTPQHQEKFFREARAAAQLRHPNIVSVHEVGRDGDSIYIVSDFVRGATLGDWLIGQQLTSREAAELCAQIADALHHAHEQGVVHRDLKPGNIMMDGGGQPHLMDFGLARREVGEVTVTLDGQILGTPAYMSPEQAQGEAHTADRRSDVYSLGVILFQLLTGELPFRGNTRMIMHQVIHDEPPSPRSLNATIHKDLETIALKCLEKAPARRYQSAKHLSDDLRHFLRSEPIEARPVSHLERGWRWCRRHPAIVSAIGLGIALIITMAVGLVAIYSAKQRAEYNRQLAERKEATVGRTLHFLQQLFRTADPVFGSAVGWRKSGDESQLSLNDVMSRAAPTVLKETVKDEPAVGVEVLSTLGDVYRSVGVYDGATQILSQARESAKVLPDNVDAKALAEFQWGWLCHDLGRYSEAAASYRAARALRLKNFPEKSLEVAQIDFNLAWLLADEDKPMESIKLFRKVLDIRRSKLKDDSFEVQTTAFALKLMLLSQNLEAEAFIDDAVIGRRPDKISMVDLVAVFRKAKAFRDAKKYDLALPPYLELYDRVTKSLNPGHPLIVYLQVDLAGLYREMGNLSAAEEMMRQAMRGSEALFKSNPKLTKPLFEFARGMAARGNVVEAEMLYRRALVSAHGHDERLEAEIKKALNDLERGKPDSGKNAPTGDSKAKKD
jgi:tetratricopeptide (TPR) repeat protein